MAMGGGLPVSAGDRAMRMNVPRRVFALAGILALLSLLPYLIGGVSRSFVTLDDPAYIYDNSQVRQGLTWGTVRWALTSTEDANWYPLRRLSHLVDVSLFGLDARGHHLMSLGWHAGAAVLLFFALHLMTGALWHSFVVAGLFAVHPLQVESVAWAAERSNVLAGFFFALTLLLWARYARRPGPWRYGVATAACALGLAAKPVLVTLPLLLLLLDLWPLGRMSLAGSPPWRPTAILLGRRLLEKAPLLLLAAASSAMALFAHRQSGSLLSLESLPLGSRLGNAAMSYWRYIGKMLWPADLALFYPHQGTGLPSGRAALAGLLLVALTAGMVALARRRPWLAAGWLWYLVTLVPMLGIVQFGSHAMADRFVYLPSVGFFLAVVWLAAGVFRTWRYRRVVLGTFAAAVLAALVAAGTVQTGYWKDSETLYKHALAVTRDNWMIRSHLAGLLAASGRQEEAIANAREAVRINPNFYLAHFNLGVSLAALGLHGEAVDHYREAIRLKSDFKEARASLGGSLAALGRSEEARSYYETTLQARDWKSCLALGVALYWDGKLEEAIRQYREGLKLKADSAALHNNLGVALEAQGRLGAAMDSYREAVRVDPGYADAQVNLGTAYLAYGMSREAEISLREAIRISEKHPDAHNNLGILLERQGNREAAAAHYRKALQVNPNFPTARANLERILAGGAR